MVAFVHGPQSTLLLLSVLLIFALVLVLVLGSQRRRAFAQRNSLVHCFSSLHTFSKELDQSGDPAQIADAALGDTLRIFNAEDGCILLGGEAADGLRHMSARGFSFRTADLLAAEPMRTHLATMPERWGPLMVFPNLRSPEVVADWQRDPVFRALTDAMRAEGLRTLIAIGLATRAKTYGTLLVGRRRLRAFATDELRLATAIGGQVSVALENWSLNRAAARRDNELRILYSVGRAMRETFDLQGQFEILRRTMEGLLEGTYFALTMQDQPEGPLETAVPFGGAAELAPETNALLRSLEEEVARSRSPRLIVEDWQWAKYPIDMLPGSPRVRTWCGIPIYFSDGSMAVLSAANMERERAIDAGQFELIQVLANEAAGAFENARVFQREQRRASHLALLNEIGRKATSVLDPKELLPNICGQVRDAFGYDLARIEIMDRATEELVVEGEAGYGKELLGRRSRWGEGLSGIAAEDGSPVLANSVLSEARYIALDPGVRSSLSLPLRYHDELLGVLSLESRREQAFTSQDVLTLKTLTDQLAIALHNARAYQFAVEEAITDGLTCLKTHRYFMEALEREWRHSSRTGRPFSVIMLDLDQFKPVNDRLGHLQGDRILTSVANLLSSQVRQSSVLARYGGDEFSILIPDATMEQAGVLAERLRASVEKEPFLAAHHVTASFGIGAFPDQGSTHEEILHVADAGMYLAKHDHGNRVRVARSAADAGQIEAYLGVEFKRMFSTGPEAFTQVLDRIEKALKSEGEVPLVNTVTSLARAIDFSDHYTRNHGQTVSRLAVQIARQLGLSKSEVEQIRRAGILHDIGKIGIPDVILYKPARLTPEEYAIMKSHCVKGQRILEPLKVEVFQRIALMVRGHHEWFEGGGYPDQLKGEEIPLGARILAVADCFDTMVSERAYKKALTHEDAVAELLRCSSTQFDPKLVAAFLESLEIHGDPRMQASQDEDENVLIEEAAS